MEKVIERLKTIEAALAALKEAIDAYKDLSELMNSLIGGISAKLRK